MNDKTNSIILMSFHLRKMFLGSRMLARLQIPVLLGNTFQKRRVWSPEPVTMDSPSGECAKQSTRYECPLSVLIFSMFLPSHTLMAFMENPCVETSQLEFLEYIILHTCDPVSIFLMHLPSLSPQTLMDLSVEPPPVARMLVWCGDQASAFTAAVCSLNLWMFLLARISQIDTTLSLPPEATMLPSEENLTPQTSCRWASHLWTTSLARTSQMATLQSLEPLVTRLELQSRVPILPLWFLFLVTYRFFSASITLILPVSSPMTRPFPHLTLLMNPSTSFSVSLSLLLQMQTALSRTTDTMSSGLQSSRLVQKSSLRRGALRILYGYLGILRGRDAGDSSGRLSWSSKQPCLLTLEEYPIIDMLALVFFSDSELQVLTSRHRQFLSFYSLVQFLPPAALGSGFYYLSTWNRFLLRLSKQQRSARGFFRSPRWELDRDMMGSTMLVVFHGLLKISIKCKIYFNDILLILEPSHAKILVPGKIKIIDLKLTTPIRSIYPEQRVYRQSQQRAFVHIGPDPPCRLRRIVPGTAGVSAHPAAPGCHSPILQVPHLLHLGAHIGGSEVVAAVDSLHDIGVRAQSVGVWVIGCVDGDGLLPLYLDGLLDALDECQGQQKDDHFHSEQNYVSHQKVTKKPINFLTQPQSYADIPPLNPKISSKTQSLLYEYSTFSAHKPKIDPVSSSTVKSARLQLISACSNPQPSLPRSRSPMPHRTITPQSLPFRWRGKFKHSVICTVLLQQCSANLQIFLMMGVSPQSQKYFLGLLSQMMMQAFFSLGSELRVMKYQCFCESLITINRVFPLSKLFLDCRIEHVQARLCLLNSDSTLRLSRITKSSYIPCFLFFSLNRAITMLQQALMTVSLSHSPGLSLLKSEYFTN